MNDLQELRAELQKALRGEGDVASDLLDRYDAAQRRAMGQKIRNRADREIRSYKPEFQEAVWHGLRRGADMIDPDGEVERDDTGWFADQSVDGNSDERFPWYPSLQLPGVCLRLPIGHPTKESCEQFIQEHVLGQPELDDAPEGH